MFTMLYVYPNCIYVYSSVAVCLYVSNNDYHVREMAIILLWEPRMQLADWRIMKVLLQLALLVEY